MNPGEPIEIGVVLQGAGSALDLPADELHLYLLDLAADDETRAACRAELSSDEQQRADRFVAELARDHFVLTRAALRSLLGSYLGPDHGPLAFAFNDYGKPSLTSPGRKAPPVHFNVSHSGHLALLAFGNSEIGVDVERHRKLADLMDVARIVFSPSELAYLEDAPAPDRTAIFYRIWTCKEALLKAEGLGLSRDAKTLCLFSGKQPSRFPAPEREIRLEGRSLQWRDLAPEYSLAWAVSAPTAPASACRWLGPGDLA